MPGEEKEESGVGSFIRIMNRKNQEHGQPYELESSRSGRIQVGKNA